MARGQNRLIVYRYQLEWKTFNNIGNQISSGSKPFETQEQADEFAQRLKQQVPRDNNIELVVRKLGSNEIIRRYKKVSGNKNYKRG